LAFKDIAVSKMGSPMPGRLSGPGLTVKTADKRNNKIFPRCDISQCNPERAAEKERLKYTPKKGILCVYKGAHREYETYKH